jgi:hypothetical protein
VFGWYARKVAGRAVRNRSILDLRAGLIAVAISVSGGDLRDCLPSLALLHQSALLLGEDPKKLFDEVPHMSTPSGSETLNSFLRRSSEQKKISTFGFREGTGPLRFDYIPLLPEFGGPSPF